MQLNIDSQQEQVILTLAAKIRGSRGGKTVTPKKLKALKRARKAAVEAAKQAA